ncbi:MAG: hypothetical protein ACYSUQ_14275, partial [Planctomycetota bacterium]
MSYQLRKFARRNKAMMAGAVIALVGMTLGTVAAVWQAIEVTAERDRAMPEARKAERINVFLQGILASADPAISDYDVTVRDAIDRAARSAETELAEEPRFWLPCNTESARSTIASAGSRTPNTTFASHSPEGDEPSATIA